MIQKKKIVGVIGTVAGLVLGFGIITYAADSYEIKSQGKIVFNNDTEETADDVVFDAADLVTLHDMVKTGKSNLSSVLNTYPNTEVASIDTFANLTTAVDTLTAVPDIYYYDKATEGPDCVRYMLIDGAYYPCDQYGVQTSEEALSGTITVVTKDDATEPSEGEIQLVKYEQIGAENLSAGSAGYADKSFILGSGADNITYRNLGISYADGRLNTNSVSYKTGYNTGITDADNRANPNSDNYKAGYEAGVKGARNFKKYYTFDSYSDTASCTVPEGSVLYENVFVYFIGGSVSERLASTAHQLQIRSATITGNTLTISVYYPANTEATVHWHAEVYVAE